MLWIHKYKPQNISRVCGNSQKIRDLSIFIQKTKNVIIYGKNGVGKKLIVNLLLEHQQIPKQNIYHIDE